MYRLKPYCKSKINPNNNIICETIRVGYHNDIIELYKNEKPPRDGRWTILIAEIMFSGYTGNLDQHIPHNKEYGKFLFNILSEEEQNIVLSNLEMHQKDIAIFRWKFNMKKNESDED